MIFVFETENDFVEADRDRLERFVTTGLGLVVCAIFAESATPEAWPEVILLDRNELVHFFFTSFVLILTKKV